MSRENDFLNMSEKEFLADNNICRAREGSKPHLVVICCRGCGHEYKAKMGHFTRCERCGKGNPPAYHLKFMQILQKGLGGMRHRA